MSLAYKLWKIGSVLEKGDIEKALRDDGEANDGKETEYVNVDFQFVNGILKKAEIKDDSVSKEKMFFTKKIGGSGGGIYYLFPNLNIHDETLEKKLIQLINTVNNIKIYNLVDVKNKEYIEQINIKCNAWKTELKGSKKKSEDEVINKLLNYPKGIYWFWFSINGKSFYELMPEIWDNWYKSPAIKDENAIKKEGYDAFTNEMTEIGFRPEIKVFSYDNYHDNLKFRVNENLPLSLESAKNIKFGWIYILENLVFYYKGLEYIIIPNFLSDDSEIYKLVLKRLKQANQISKNKMQSLNSFVDKEKKLNKDIERYEKKKNKQKKDIDEINNLKNEKEYLLEELGKSDRGLIQQFNDELEETGNLKDSIIVDYIFVSLNRTDLSFEIKGSIEDVIPGHITAVVNSMRNNNICELVTLKKRDKEKTYIQDFFNRNELCFVINKSSKNNRNIILKEKLYLAKLLLNDEKIKFNDLLKRYEKNREYGYDNTKRVLKEGIKEWVEFPDKFIKDESNARKFLTDLNKIKE